MNLSHKERWVLCCRYVHQGLMPTAPHLMRTWSALMTPGRYQLVSWQGQSAFDV